MALTGWLAAAVIAAFLAVVLRRQVPEQGLALSVAAGLLIVIAVVSEALPLFRELRSLLSRSGLDGEYVTVLFKALGVCLLTQLASDACRDAGEQGLAAKAELAGKLTLLSVGLPLFRKLGDIALALMQGGDL